MVFCGVWTSTHEGSTKHYLTVLNPIKLPQHMISVSSPKQIDNLFFKVEQLGLDTLCDQRTPLTALIGCMPMETTPSARPDLT